MYIARCVSLGLFDVHVYCFDLIPIWIRELSLGTYTVCQILYQGTKNDSSITSWICHLWLQIKWYSQQLGQKHPFLTKLTYFVRYEAPLIPLMISLEENETGDLLECDCFLPGFTTVYMLWWQCGSRGPVQQMRVSIGHLSLGTIYSFLKNYQLLKVGSLVGNKTCL